MGWFNKKEEKEKVRSLPDLPSFSNIPSFKNEYSRDISQLPSFPNNPLAEKFSQNTIKDAVTGKKEVKGEEEVDGFDENQMMPNSPSFAHVPDFPSPARGISVVQRRPMANMRREEPIFIRLDKFEESLNNFEEIKKQVNEIEKILEDTRMLKDKEIAEIESWEKEIKDVKTKIEKIDKELFSKID